MHGGYPTHAHDQERVAAIRLQNSANSCSAVLPYGFVSNTLYIAYARLALLTATEPFRVPAIARIRGGSRPPLLGRVRFCALLVRIPWCLAGRAHVPSACGLAGRSGHQSADVPTGRYINSMPHPEHSVRSASLLNSAALSRCKTLGAPCIGQSALPQIADMVTSVPSK
jgi:hypothetical protein